MSTTNSIRIGTRVRTADGRVGTVHGYLGGVSNTDATARIVFDDGSDDWLTDTEVTSVDGDGTDDTLRARARQLAKRALFDDTAQGLTGHDLDVLGSCLRTEAICGTGYRVQARKLARRGLVAITVRFVPGSVYVATATDLGREFHAWWMERARAVFAARLKAVAS
jgi:uncharacterized protein YdbL (DUF1318 family)